MNIKMALKNIVGAKVGSAAISDIRIGDTLVFRKKTILTYSDGSIVYKDVVGTLTLTAVERTNLVSCSVGSAVDTIGSLAFYNCTTLTSVEFQSSIKRISDSAFLGCVGLVSITLPLSVIRIDSSAFNGCDGLTSVRVNDSVETLGESVFRFCEGLTSVVFSADENADMGCNTFCDCPNIVSATILAPTSEIPMGMFSGCSSLRSVSLPSTIVKINENAFSDCSALNAITIPNAVTYIGSSAFLGTSITSIIIPASVSTITGPLFYECASLSSISVASGNIVFDSRNSCNAIIETSTNELVEGCYSTTIPSTVTKIGSCAFEGITRLTTITIPESVSEIGGAAFGGCTGLRSITCKNSIPPTLDSSSFRDVTKTIPVYVPSSSISAYSQASYWSEFSNFRAIS